MLTALLLLIMLCDGLLTTSVRPPPTSQPARHRVAPMTKCPKGRPILYNGTCLPRKTPRRDDHSEE
jgi:hypothetical protein